MDRTIFNTYRQPLEPLHHPALSVDPPADHGSPEVTDTNAYVGAASVPGITSSLTAWSKIRYIKDYFSEGVRYKKPELILKGILAITQLPIAFLKSLTQDFMTGASLVHVKVSTILAGVLGGPASAALAAILSPILIGLGIAYLSIEACKSVGNLIANIKFANDTKVSSALKFIDKLEKLDETDNLTPEIKSILDKFNQKFKLSDDNSGVDPTLLRSGNVTKEDAKFYILKEATKKILTNSSDRKQMPRNTAQTSRHAPIEDDSPLKIRQKQLFLAERLGNSTAKAFMKNAATLKTAEAASRTFQDIKGLDSKYKEQFNIQAKKILETTKTQQKKALAVHTTALVMIGLCAIAIIFSIAASGGVAIPLFATLGVSASITLYSATQQVLTKGYLENKEDKINLRLLVPTYFSNPVKTPLWKKAWSKNSDLDESTKAKARRKHIALTICTLGIAGAVDGLRDRKWIKKIRNGTDNAGEIKAAGDDYGDTLQLPDLQDHHRQSPTTVTETPS